ncbi:MULTISPECIES: hypothetical protein [Rhodanobacter]|uniref:hypothetical protein n=1 Tax=Rhodanobacter TaxID=75309 RepID=UPI001F199A4F|nr:MULTISPECIES: hypothetical protein [Rhodanobacter]UJJ53530.1 hypothetical protein LRK53_11085 [Rhodanobacter thiooxydans]
MNLHFTCCTADQLPPADRQRIEQLAAAHRQADADFADWAAGYGVIRHDALTQVRVREMVAERVVLGRLADAATGWRRLAAADRLASAGMWLVVHMTYARRMRTDGGALEADDFKATPEGHTGGSLNMVPAYTAYLLMDALDGVTRAWMMGQGYCVAAIDALNLLVGNMTDAHAARYDRSDAGLSRFASDFYAYTLNPDGTQRRRSVRTSTRTPPVACWKAVTWASRNCSTCTRRSRASAWSPSSATAPSRSNAAATGRRAGGAPRTAGWSAPSSSSTAAVSSSAASRVASAGWTGTCALTDLIRYPWTAVIRPASPGAST